MSTISERVTPHRRRIRTRVVPYTRTALTHMAERYNVVCFVLAAQATLYAHNKRGMVRWKVVYIRAAQYWNFLIDNIINIIDIIDIINFQK